MFNFCGFTYEEIPERRYMPFLAEKYSFDYFDTFQFIKNKGGQMDDMFIHPRYAYFNKKGAEYVADIIFQALKTWNVN